MSYITLIIVGVVIIIISFVFSRNSKRGKNISFPKSFRKVIDTKEEDVEALMKKKEKNKEKILEIMKEEIAKQRQIIGSHLGNLGNTIKGMTIYDIEKISDMPESVIEICLNELENENKIRRMKISGKTVHYIPTEQ